MDPQTKKTSPLIKYGRGAGKLNSRRKIEGYLFDNSVWLEYRQNYPQIRNKWSKRKMKAVSHTLLIYVYFDIYVSK